MCKYAYQACNFALTGLFFFFLVIKIDMLTDSVRPIVP